VVAVQRLEAALGPALARDPPSRERLGKALETLRPEVVEVEQTADQAARAGADDHRARRSQPPQSRGEVRGLADHDLLSRRTRADQIAD
jgi:hypothetical protein